MSVNSPLVSLLLNSNCTLVLFHLKSAVVQVKSKMLAFPAVCKVNHCKVNHLLPFKDLSESFDQNLGHSNGLAIQDDPTVDFWHHHLNLVLAQSECTLGVSTLGKVGGLGQLLDFAHRTRLMALDFGLNVSHPLATSEEFGMYAAARNVGCP